MDDDDPVVQELDVFLSKGLADQLYLFQYPVRPACLSYNEVPHLAARIKPNQQKVELELAINANGANYARSKGEQIALNVDGPEKESDNPVFSTDVMDKQTLSSLPSARDVAQYAIGVVRNREVHLTPIRGVVQLKPSFSYLDKADSRNKTDSGGAGDAGEAEEETEAKPVTVRYSRPESEEAKARRLASFEYINKKHQEEPWIECDYHGSDSYMWEREYRKLAASLHRESSEFYMSKEDYMKTLVPPPNLKPEEKPPMPNDVLSMTQLKTMSLNDQVRALLINAKLIRFSQLMALLPRDTDPVTCLRALQQVALLVQGCWVVKSEVLSPKDTFSPHTGIPADILNRGRDFVLWRFRQSRAVVRKDLASIIKLPGEDVKEILEQVSRVKVNRGWEFIMEYDKEFTDKYPDIVQRQNMLWDAKYQQLAQQFKITKEMEKKFMCPMEPVPENATRRRTSSRSKSKSMSDSSDADDTKMDTSDMNGQHKPGRKRKSSVRSETNGVIEISNNVHNSDSPVVDFMTELTTFVKEKLYSRYVLTLSDLRRLLSVQIGPMSGGKILDVKGLSDELLVHAINSVGGTKVDNQNHSEEQGEPTYALMRLGDKLDPIRTLILDMFRQSARLKISAIKARASSELETYSENDLRRILKDYCITKGGMWQLKGTT